MNNKKDRFDDFEPAESKDLENESLDLKDPFDPKEIDIQVQQTTMSTLIDRLAHNEIDLNPDFQRTADLWNSKTKGRLIESLLIRFPIPAFYFDATDEDKWLVVDGLQRLTSIKKFVIDKNLKLNGLEFIKEFEKKNYDNLPRTFKRRIDQAPVTLYLIKPGTPQNVKYSLFYRINTGGLTLNPQEIRHALSQSINDAQASIFLKRLSDLEIFQRCVRVSDRRMLDKELVLRYIAFKLTDFKHYKEPMIKFLNDTMEDLGKIKTSRLELLEKGFEKAITLAWEIFEEDAFRKSILDKQSTRKVVNRALFEVVTVVFSDLNDDEAAIIKSNKQGFVNDYLNLLGEKKFNEAISTTYSKNIIYRFEKFQNLVNIHIAKAEG